MLDDIAANLLERHVRVVLGRNDHRVHAHRRVAVVLDGDLGLAVRAQIRERAVLAHLRQPLGELVRERDGQRHQFRRLVAGVAEHHALVAGAEAVVRVRRAVLGFIGLVDALGDVRRLDVDGRQHAAGGAVESVIRLVVPDPVHDLACDGGDVHIAARGNLAHHVNHAGRRGHFAGHVRVRILREDGVQHGVGDLVADFVRVSFGHGLGCKKSF